MEVAAAFSACFCQKFCVSASTPCFLRNLEAAGEHVRQHNQITKTTFFQLTQPAMAGTKIHSRLVYARSLIRLGLAAEPQARSYSQPAPGN